MALRGTRMLPQQMLQHTHRDYEISNLKSLHLNQFKKNCTLEADIHRVRCRALRNCRLEDMWARGFEHNKMGLSGIQDNPPYQFEKL